MTLVSLTHAFEFQAKRLRVSVEFAEEYGVLQQEVMKIMLGVKANVTCTEENSEPHMARHPRSICISH